MVIEWQSNGNALMVVSVAPPVAPLGRSPIVVNGAIVAAVGRGPSKSVMASRVAQTSALRAARVP
jgi:hypothetical protein